MFKKLTAALQALVAIAALLEQLVDAVHGLTTGGAETVDLDRRLAAVERDIERRFAESEGLLLKAKGKHDAARAAEERARRLAASAEDSEPDLEDFAEAFQANGVLPGDAPAGGDEGVPAVRGGMAGRHASKSNAYAAKWGR